MQKFDYLIIGGGVSADAAINGIRETDRTGTVGMIGKDATQPYNRPPLSKALWKNEPEEILWRNTGQKDVKMFLGRTAQKIDIKNKTVTDDQDQVYSFNKLLLATGGKVNRLSPDMEGIIYYRTYEDYQQLKKLTSVYEKFVVVGGGFIGSEIAAALAMNGKKVTMIFPGEGLGANVFPKPLSFFLNRYYAEKGVKLIPGDRISEIKKQDDEFRITTRLGKSLSAQGVVAGIGIRPDTSLASSAGIKTGDGIIVDEYLQTSEPDIYAAGDAANFFSPALNKNLRVEHEDNSLTMGAIAGRNMAGAKEKYNHIPFFYSDLFDLGYEAVGDLDPAYETVIKWKEEFREGIIYYLHERRVRGVLLWNTWGQVDHARALIAENKVFDSKNVMDRLPV